MMVKYKGKYRIESNRLKGWDYSNNGLYFITIVTQHRQCNLGDIKNNKMVLSDFGKIVNDQWNKSFEIRDELLCDEYIIMPNHMHAIVILEKPIVTRCSVSSNVSTVKTNGRSSLPPPSPPSPPSSPLPQQQPKSISSFVGGFKSATNSKIDNYIDENNLDIPKYNRNNHFFQPNYHDHIIRNEKSYHNIKKYIHNNPAQWKTDKFNPENQ